MPQWMQDLADGWPMIAAYPKTFVAIVIAIVVVVWVIISWSYSAVLASKNAQIELLDRQIANLKQNPQPAQPHDAYAPRRLSEGQRRDMTDRLKNGKERIIIQYDMACGDCAQYAADFTSVFRDAEGWQVSQGMSLGPSNRPASGLAFRIPDLNNPSVEAKRIIRALNANNIRFDLQRLEFPQTGGPLPLDAQFLIVAP